MKTALEAMSESEYRPKLSTGCMELDEAIGGVEPGLMYLLYGDSQVVDSMLHRLLVGCVLPVARGGLGSQSLYFNVCNYYEGKTILDPDLLGKLSKAAGIEPSVILSNVHAVFAFNENQMLTASEEVARRLADGAFKLLIIHNATKFLLDSGDRRRSLEVLRQALAPLRQKCLENMAAFVVSVEPATLRRSEVPSPLGGSFFRHAASVIIYLRRGERSVEAILLKHPTAKTPQHIIFRNSFPGVDLLGRVTPSFRQLYQKQVDELRKNLQAALLDPGHREAFNKLLKEVWGAEEHAMSNSKLPVVLDAMNIMANIHSRKLIADIEKKLEELERESSQLRLQVEELRRVQAAKR